MSSECFFINPLRRDGTSQRQRAPRGLDPGYARIDERSLTDLLVYARDYARLLHYYTPSNGIGGDWVELIENDVTALVALIRNADLSEVKEAFEAQVEVVEDADAADVLAQYAKLFEFILDVAGTIDRWHRDLERGLAVWRDLDRLVRSALNDALREALVLSLRVNQLNGTIDSIGTAIEALGDAWEMSSVEPDVTVFPHGKPITEDDLGDAVRRLTTVFERFYEAHVFLSQNTARYLRETLVEFPRHEPHMALFLAFLHVFGHAQHHLNSLGAKHLDFYYEDVLRLRHKPAVADRAHVVFELAKNAEPHRLAEGTPLKAGKDASGVELTYEAVDELVVNRAAIDEEHGLKTVFVQHDEDGEVVAIHAAPDADSADGLGAELEGDDGKWATLGSTSMPFAAVGFAVASPMFLLSEGTRKISVTFRLRESVPVLDANARKELERNVRVAFTGDGGWIVVPVAKVAVGFADGKTAIVYELTIDPEAGPILPFDGKTHAGGFDTEHPVIRFMLDADGLSAAQYAALDLELGPEATVSTVDLGITDYADEVEAYPAGSTVRHRGRLYRNEADIADAGAEPGVDPRWTRLERSYPYRYFERFRLRGLDIALDVDGIRSLVFENDVGALDPAKPFLPFGPVPKVGGSFLIGSSEVFYKPVTALDLTIDWADLPQAKDGFSQHYAGYGVTMKGNQHFTATLSLLEAGRWRNPDTGSGVKRLQLFNPSDKKKLAVRSAFPISARPRLARTTEAGPFHRFGTKLRQGFMRLQLDESFLHAAYPRVLAAAVAAQDPANFPIPNAPYTPLISFLSLDFEAGLELDYDDLSKTDFDDRVERVFQIGPFGHREIFPIAADPTAAGVPVDHRLVPHFGVTVRDDNDRPHVVTAEGSLLIGVARLEPPQNLSLLIRLAEGSEDPRGRAPEVAWSYLSNDEWVDFADTEVLGDGTGGLLRSGVVELAVPRKATRSAKLLPGSLHWLKAAVAEGTRSIPRAVALHTQAVAARFVDRGNDPAHLATALPAGTIAKLKHREAAIKSVTQPYASFGGRLAETAPAFRVRVSERLRHKGRAVSIFDYERLVLEAFPEVYKVKCLNHSKDGCEHAPGHVALVVVPDLRNQNAVDPLRPQLSLGKLELIREHLRRIASDFVSIEVVNPSYEQVRSDFAVRFHKGIDQGLYTRQLQKDLVKFLSPWLYDEAADLTFGGRVHRSAVLHFVEELDYVDFVTDFKLEQVLEDGETLRDVEEAEATTSSAALVSAADHAIAYATGTCADNA